MQAEELHDVNTSRHILGIDRQVKKASFITPCEVDASKAER